MGVASRAISEVIHGRRSITPAMSIRFGAFFGKSDEFWHGLQMECDFRRMGRQKHSLAAGILPASTLRQMGRYATLSIVGSSVYTDSASSTALSASKAMK